jgi:hypothetical protein
LNRFISAPFVFDCHRIKLAGSLFIPTLRK